MSDLSTWIEFNPPVSLEKGKDYPFVGMDQVQPRLRYVSAATQRNFPSSGARFRHGDTLFARITPCLENGKIAQFIAESEIFGFGSTEFFVLRAKENIADPAFVYYLAKTELFRGTAIQSMVGASGRQRADVESLRQLKIDIPDLPTQQKIGQVLAQYDDLIETNRRRIALLEEAARLLYRQLIARGQPSWELTTLEQICGQVKDQVDPTKVAPEIPYLSMEHMQPKSVALCTWETAGKVSSSKLQFQRKDVLFGRIRPYFHKVGVAQINGITSTDMIVVRSKSEELLPLVALTMSSDEFVAHAVTTSNGTKMPRADWKVLKHWAVRIPPPEELSEFAGKVLSIFELLEVLSAQSKALATARDELLPRLIFGAVQV